MRSVQKRKTWLVTPHKVRRSQPPFEPADVDLVAVNEQTSSLPLRTCVPCCSRGQRPTPVWCHASTRKKLPQHLELEFLHRDRPFAAPCSTSTSTRLKVVTRSPSVIRSDLSSGVLPPVV